MPQSDTPNSMPPSAAPDDILDKLEEALERIPAPEFDGAEIERIISRLEAGRPLRAAFDPETAWAGLEERHPLFFAEKAREGGRSPLPEPARREGRRPRRRMPAMLAAALAVAALLAGMLTAQAMGLDVFGALGRWTDEEFSFTRSADEEEPRAVQNRPGVNEEVRFDTLEDAFATYGITTPLLPTWLPEGYVCTEASATGSSMATTYYSLMKCGDVGLSINIFETKPGEEQVFAVYEKSKDEVTVYEYSGIKHYIFRNSGDTIISWINQNYECSIDGFYDLETAKKIIESIYKVKD